MEWHYRKFNELSNNELYNLLKARVEVFVVEQDCPYPELDDYDQKAVHCYLDIKGEPAALVRLLPAGSKFEHPSIGRVMVAEKHRGKGYGKEVMKRAMAYITEVWSEDSIHIMAQEYLKQFYMSLGFRQASEMYLEDNIPHIDMIWERS
ncbi:GNAT family N-acetyltransferase [Virgibacillus xinjiangensis]|uniref:GNAT family N-acetyltransferase n=1 Tax=Virgibacillus xinjiangensis TaxID=393090 RepID=A0ABV7CSG3_9BACI